MTTEILNSPKFRKCIGFLNFCVLPKLILNLLKLCRISSYNFHTFLYLTHGTIYRSRKSIKKGSTENHDTDVDLPKIQGRMAGVKKNAISGRY